MLFIESACADKRASENRSRGYDMFHVCLSVDARVVGVCSEPAAVLSRGETNRCCACVRLRVRVCVRADADWLLWPSHVTLPRAVVGCAFPAPASVRVRAARERGPKAKMNQSRTSLRPRALFRRAPAAAP